MSEDWAFKTQENGTSEIESWINNLCAPKNTTRIQGFVTTQSGRASGYYSKLYCAQDLSRNKYNFKLHQWKNEPNSVQNILFDHDANLLGFIHSSDRSGYEDFVLTVIGENRQVKRDWNYKTVRNSLKDIEEFINSPECSPSDITGIRGFASQLGKTKPQGANYDLHVWCRNDRANTSFRVETAELEDYKSLLLGGSDVIMLGHFLDSFNSYQIIYAQ